MRLFIATQLPPDAAQPIATAAGRLRGLVPAAGWVKPDRYHLTWAFLGDHEESAVGRLEASLHRVTPLTRSVPVRIAGAGFFPSISRARVGWLALAPAEPLKEIAAEVRHAVAEARVAFDDKAFVPHLTVVRMRQPWKPKELEHFVHEMGAVEADANIDHLSLFRSDLRPEGALHTELARIRLGPPHAEPE